MIKVDIKITLTLYVKLDNLKVITDIIYFIANSMSEYQYVCTVHVIMA